jgi:hypothetical protein
MHRVLNSTFIPITWSTQLLIVAIDTPGGNLSLKIKSRAQQITLKPNIIKVKILIS